MARPEFVPFPKIARLSRECIITEKLDGTNAQITITPEGKLFAGSRNRWITPADDNYGFATWCKANKAELLKLGEGTHFGEWWGNGIQRNYRLKEKRFSLFNTTRWLAPDAVLPACCHVVPELFRGIFTTNAVANILSLLSCYGSTAAPGFMQPEGIVIYHTASKTLFKKTILGDEKPKNSNG